MLLCDFSSFYISRIMISLFILTQVLSCGLNHVPVQPPIQIPPPSTFGRLLKQQLPHPIRIDGEFVLEGGSETTARLIQTVFNISTNYYSKIIKVTTTQISELPSIAISACNMTEDKMPKKYLNGGFNTSTTDLIIFVQLLSDISGNYVALATACVSVRRPIYGYMNINPVQFVQTTTSSFQTSLQIIIHQTAHVLGFGRIYFSNFYTSPTSLETLPITSVLRNISGRTYVISPNVMSYVQKYFDCNDNLTGALLQNQGTASTALNHWERVVYFNQLMTSSALPIGMRFSGLSLSLLKDTNYYSSVDTSLSQQIFWGYRRGCLFARSEIQSPPEYCNPDASPRVACDYYSDSISFCVNGYDPYAENSSFYVPYSNGICSNQSLSNTTGTDYLNIRYGPSSKCFYARLDRENMQPLDASTCYQTDCMVNGSIRVTVGDSYDNCIYPGQKLKFNNITVSCPNDFRIFCSGKTCRDQCNNRGFCIKGACVCKPPYRGSFCEITCDIFYDNATTLCVNSCKPTEYISPPNICVNVCPPNYVSNLQRKCQYCDDKCQSALRSPGIQINSDFYKF